MAGNPDWHWNASCAPAEPTVAPDPELDAILGSGLPGPIQDELIGYLQRRREADLQRRLDELHAMIKLVRGRPA